MPPSLTGTPSSETTPIGCGVPPIKNLQVEICDRRGVQDPPELPLAGFMAITAGE